MPRSEGTLSFRLRPSVLSEAAPRFRCSLLLGGRLLANASAYFFRDDFRRRRPPLLARMFVKRCRRVAEPSSVSSLSISVTTSSTVARRSLRASESGTSTAPSSSGKTSHQGPRADRIRVSVWARSQDIGGLVARSATIPFRPWLSTIKSPTLSFAIACRLTLKLSAGRHGCRGAKALYLSGLAHHCSPKLPRACAAACC
jgi:hypothetical protein